MKPADANHLERPSRCVAFALLAGSLCATLALLGGCQGRAVPTLPSVSQFYRSVNLGALYGKIAPGDATQGLAIHETVESTTGARSSKRELRARARLAPGAAADAARYLQLALTEQIRATGGGVEDGDLLVDDRVAPSFVLRYKAGRVQGEIEAELAPVVADTRGVDDEPRAYDVRVRIQETSDIRAAWGLVL